MARQSHSSRQRYARTAIWHDKAIATDHYAPAMQSTKQLAVTDYPNNAVSSPRNDSLLRTTLALRHLAHVTTRCYGLATRLTHPRLTQRTVKTGISIYRPRRSCNAAFSPRNDSLLRIALALQQLAHVTTRCYGLTTTTRHYQRNVKTGTSIYQRPTDLSCPQRPSSCIQRLDRSQLPATTIQLHPTTRQTSAYPHQTSSCISTTRPTPATLVERPAAHNYNSTIPANDVTHPSWRPHYNRHVHLHTRL